MATTNSTASTPLSFYYSISYGDYEGPVNRRIVEAVLSAIPADNIFYDSKGRLNCYSPQKGNEAPKMAKAIADGPTVNIYLNNSKALAQYLDAVGKKGTDSFLFCIKQVVDNVHKYLKCFMSKKDYYVNKNNIKSSFCGLDGKPKDVFRFGQLSLSLNKEATNAIRFRKSLVRFSMSEKTEFTNNLIPLLSIKFGNRSGKSIVSISSFVLLVAYLIRLLLFTVCPYADGEGHIVIKPEHEVMKLLGFNTSLSEKRANLIKIMSGDFGNYIFEDEKMLDKDLLSSYLFVLKNGLVFNRIFREYIDYNVTKIKTVPAIFLARKFKRVK